MDQFETKCTLDIILSVWQVLYHQMSWSTVFFQQSSRDKYWSRVWSIWNVQGDLRMSVRIHATDFLAYVHQSEKFDFLSTFLTTSTLFPNSHPLLRISWYPSSIWISVSNSSVMSASAPWILSWLDGNNFAKHHLNDFVATLMKCIDNFPPPQFFPSLLFK